MQFEASVPCISRRCGCVELSRDVAFAVARQLPMGPQAGHGMQTMMSKWIVLAIVAAATASVHAQDASKPNPADVQAHNRVIGQSLAAVTPVKTAVEGYRLRAKRFPASNAELGMNLPETYRNYDIKSIAVTADGVIDMTLSATSGVDGGVIRFTPTATGSTDNPTIEWHCASASYTTIGDATGGLCEHTNQP